MPSAPFENDATINLAIAFTKVFSPLLHAKFAFLHEYVNLFIAPLKAGSQTSAPTADIGSPLSIRPLCQPRNGLLRSHSSPSRVLPR